MATEAWQQYPTNSAHNAITSNLDSIHCQFCQREDTVFSSNKINVRITDVGKGNSSERGKAAERWFNQNDADAKSRLHSDAESLLADIHGSLVEDLRIRVM
jgi:hypothetical protein